MKLALAIVLDVVFVIILVVVTGSCMMKENTVERDTGSWLDRAQVAANATDMHDYLQKTREGLEKYNMTHGNAALIFKRPDNDMALIYDAVKQLESRVAKQADLLQADPQYVNTTTYQVALDDMRGTARELNLQQLGYYWRHDGFPQMFFAVISWIGLLVGGVGVTIWGIANTDTGW
jgi:hypothetical protein